MKMHVFFKCGIFAFAVLGGLFTAARADEAQELVKKLGIPLAQGTLAENIPAQIDSLLKNHAGIGLRGGDHSGAANHIQGMAALADGNWVIAHDLYGQKSGEFRIVDPLKRYRIHTETLNFGVKGCPSGMSAAGNILAVTTGEDGHVRFFDCTDSTKPKALTHLDLPQIGDQGCENAALCWCPKHSRYYLFKNNTMYVSSSANLADTNTKFKKIGLVGSEQVAGGEGGSTMICESPSNDLYIFALGRVRAGGAHDDYTAENDFCVYKIKTGAGPEDDMILADTPKYYKLNDGWGSFRWGGTTYVNPAGRLTILAAPYAYKLTGFSDFGTWTSKVGNPVGVTYRLTVTEVECIKTSDTIGKDKIYLKFGDGKIWTKEDGVSKGNKWNPDPKEASVLFTTPTIKFSLHESDDDSPDDDLGTINYFYQTPSLKIEFNGDGGKYNVTFKCERVK